MQTQNQKPFLIIILRRLKIPQSIKYARQFFALLTKYRSRGRTGLEYLKVFLKPPEKRKVNFPRKLDVAVVSYGGSATTMLLEFLQKKHCVTNDPYNRDGLKHSIMRSNVDFSRCSRVVYLFGDPQRVVASVFRRGLQFEHALNMQVNFKRLPYSISAGSIEEYAEFQSDGFLLERHFNFWFDSRLPIPALFIRYEALWDNIGVLFDFLDLPAAAQDDFPERISRKSMLSDPEKKLEQVYGGLAERMSALPDCILHAPPPPLR